MVSLSHPLAIVIRLLLNGYQLPSGIVRQEASAASSQCRVLPVATNGACLRPASVLAPQRYMVVASVDPNDEIVSASSRRLNPPALELAVSMVNRSAPSASALAPTCPPSEARSAITVAPSPRIIRIAAGVGIPQP